MGKGWWAKHFTIGRCKAHLIEPSFLWEGRGNLSHDLLTQLHRKGKGEKKQQPNKLGIWVSRLSEKCQFIISVNHIVIWHWAESQNDTGKWWKANSFLHSLSAQKASIISIEQISWMDWRCKPAQMEHSQLANSLQLFADWIAIPEWHRIPSSSSSYLL